MKTFIGYASMSGNTEDMANILKEVLLKAGCEVDMECLDTVEVVELLVYDFIFIGSYTWGDGDLPYEAEDFFEDLSDWELNDIYAACFGSGDSAYPKFCQAVDILADKLEDRGCEIFRQKLKMELGPNTNEQRKECGQFARSVYEWVLEKKEMKHV